MTITVPDVVEPAAVGGPRPFRFGILLRSVGSMRECADVGRTAEDLGYATAFVGEHLDMMFGPFSMAAAIASATTSLRVGTLMLLNEMRHPTVLAKEAATLDVLAEGRLELGIGAGWKESDYRAIGRELPPGHVRVERLRETITVVKGLFADGPFGFSGTHVTINGLEGVPKPYQRPHPPFIVGGAGRAVMSLAAAEARIVGINPSLRPGPLSPDAVSMDAARRTVGYLAVAAGDRMSEIELNLLPLKIMVTNAVRSAVRSVSSDYGLDEDVVAASPFFLIGSPDAIAERLAMLRHELGISYIVARQELMREFASVVGRLTGVRAA